MVSIKMHSTDGRFVTGPSDILFAGVYVCIFQPANFTSWGSEGVKGVAVVSLLSGKTRLVLY